MRAAVGFFLLLALPLFSFAEEGGSPSLKSVEKIPPIVQQIEQDVAKLAQLVEAEGVTSLSPENLKCVGGDSYAWIIDDQGFAYHHGLFKWFSGKDQSRLQGPAGNYVIGQMISLLEKQDSAWMSYFWVKPGDKKATRKLSYVQKVANAGKTYILGCGTHSIKSDNAIEAVLKKK